MTNEIEPGSVRLPSDETREVLMLQAAKLYYELDKTQNEIARELGLTRWQVSRLIREAREVGVVRIEILPRSQRRAHLEATLQKVFGLREAIVVRQPESHDEALTIESVAQAAGRYLATINPQPALVGVSWGRTMAAVARWLHPAWTGDVHVVLVNGATTHRSTAYQANFVAERFAQTAASGRATLLPVPAIVGKSTTREVLEQDPVIAEVLALGASAPFVCFSMGALSAKSVLVDSGYLDLRDLERLRLAGAVGDILGRFIDARGNIVDPELDARTIGLRPEALRDIPWAIGISAGEAKHEVVLSCLEAGYVKVLITDEATAQFALEHRHG
jgi:deoxyribonucleoside regulator